jgi:hypothetical protein
MLGWGPGRPLPRNINGFYCLIKISSDNQCELFSLLFNRNGFHASRIAAILVVDQMYLGVQLSKRSEFAAVESIARERA